MRFDRLVNLAFIWTLLLLCTPVIAKATIGSKVQLRHIIRFRGKPGEELKGQVRFTSHRHRSK